MLSATLPKNDDSLEIVWYSKNKGSLARGNSDFDTSSQMAFGMSCCQTKVGWKYWLTGEMLLQNKKVNMCKSLVCHLHGKKSMSLYQKLLTFHVFLCFSFTVGGYCLITKQYLLHIRDVVKVNVCKQFLVWKNVSDIFCFRKFCQDCIWDLMQLLTNRR